MRFASIRFIMIILIFGLVSGCRNETTKTVSYQKVRLFAEGPLFEGSNTLQGNLDNNLQQPIKESQLSIEDMSSAKLKSITLSLDDSSNFDLLSSITIQFVSDKTDMMELALINPIAKGSKTLKLIIADEQKDLMKLLQQEKFTVVADVIFNKDCDKDFEIMGDFEFELTYKK